MITAVCWIGAMALAGAAYYARSLPPVMWLCAYFCLVFTCMGFVML